MRIASLFLVPSLFMLTACSPSAATCVQNATQACLCSGGGSAVQTCRADGTFEPCPCTGSDAGPPIDAAHTDDAASTPDTGIDAAPDDDAALAPDSGVACPAPFVVCGGSCIDPRTDATYCGASASCAGAEAGTTCGAGCAGGRCVWDNCRSALDAGHTSDGIYQLDLDGSGPLQPSDAYCDMTTDGGGWTLTYRIRNDIPDISDPWIGMVNLGSGDTFPANAMPLPVGTHFDGPTREVRLGFAGHQPPGTLPELRVTMIAASDGHVIFDVATHNLGGVAMFAIGYPGTWANYNGGAPMVVIGTSGSLPAVGTMGDEHIGTGSDADVFAPGGVLPTPLFGDASVASFLAEAANSTTLFWMR